MHVDNDEIQAIQEGEERGRVENNKQNKTIQEEQRDARWYKIHSCNQVPGASQRW